jgi:glutamate racemase
MNIVDSAAATALAAAALVPRGEGEAACSFFATDSVEKFRRLGGMFLGRELPEVGLVDLGG